MGKNEGKGNELVNLGGDISDAGNAEIAHSEPYTAQIRLRGSSDMLFHRWQSDEVEAKSKSAKNSKAKKTDNVEAYVWRDEDGGLCIPGEYLRMSMVNAAKFRQDPRSPRKSAMDLFKAALVPLTTLAPLGLKKWDYEDRRRAVVQRSGISRVRPAFRSGWEATFLMMCTLPEYVSPNDMHEVAAMAGRVVGLADFRPTFGRFVVAQFDLAR